MNILNLITNLLLVLKREVTEYLLIKRLYIKIILLIETWVINKSQIS